MRSESLTGLPRPGNAGRECTLPAGDWAVLAAQKGAPTPQRKTPGGQVPCPGLQRQEAQPRIPPPGCENGLLALHGRSARHGSLGLSTHTGHVVVTPMATEEARRGLQCRWHAMKLKLSKAESPAWGRPRPWSGSSVPSDCAAHQHPRGTSPSLSTG